ncbi:hypothetical protein VTH82DRAFT_6811 [Thermothelomyces myriococcoides]
MALTNGYNVLTFISLLILLLFPVSSATKPTTTATPTTITTPPVIPCTVGNDTPCPPGSTCTPTTYSTPGVPWSGQCISAPVTTTICTVGQDYDGSCPTGSTCTPTMTCTSGIPCGGACIGTAPPDPPSTTSTTTRGRPCTIGYHPDPRCGPRSTCYPTIPCWPTIPCRGTCTPKTWSHKPTSTSTCHDGSY